MNARPYEELKKNIQEIIDLIVAKNAHEANNKLTAVTEIIDELLDHATEDEELLEITRYQVLVNQLYQKINAS